jgi:hypothetical protein
MRQIAEHRATRGEGDVRTRIRNLHSALQKPGRRPSLRLSLEVAGLVAIIGFIVPAIGFAGKSDPEAKLDPVIEILVYNIVQAPPAAVGRAETEAGRILAEAGLRAVWIDCLDRHSTDARTGLCGKAREPVDVVLRFLPGQTRSGSQDNLFGVAFLPTLASVYYEYAVRLAGRDNEVPVILGCAIAHEVGHLLLGPSSHSAGGIMLGEWGPKELQLALMGRLLFASQQAKLIQAEARRRMSLQTGTAKEQRLATVDPRGPNLKSSQSD